MSGMGQRVRLTMATMAVLDVLMSAGPDQKIWGFRLCEEANLGSGTVYPLLERLEQTGWVESHWEENPPGDRPRRRFYEITGAGRADYRSALAVREAKRRQRLPGTAHAGGVE